MPRFLGSTGLLHNGQVQNDIGPVQFDPNDIAVGDERYVIQSLRNAHQAVGIILRESYNYPPGLQQPDWTPLAHLPANLSSRITNHLIPLPITQVPGALLTNRFRDPNLLYQAFMFSWGWKMDLYHNDNSHIYYIKHGARVANPNNDLQLFYQPPLAIGPPPQACLTISWGPQINQYRSCNP